MKIDELKAELQSWIDQNFALLEQGKIAVGHRGEALVENNCWRTAIKLLDKLALPAESNDSILWQNKYQEQLDENDRLRALLDTLRVRAGRTIEEINDEIGED